LASYFDLFHQTTFGLSSTPHPSALFAPALLQAVAVVYLLFNEKTRREKEKQEPFFFKKSSGEGQFN